MYKKVNDCPSRNSDMASLLAKSLIDFKNKKPQDVAKRLPQMYDRGLLFKKNNESDKAFVLLKRYLHTIEWIQKTKDFRENRAFYMKYMPTNQVEEVKVVWNELNELLTVFPKVNENTRDIILNADKRLPPNENTLNDEALDIVSNFPDIPTDEPINGEVDDFITCMQLYEVLSHDRYLIIDIRPTEDFDRSSIKSKRCVNIPPSEIKQGILVRHLEDYLHNHRSQIEEELFIKRTVRYLDRLILMDWMTNRNTIEKSKYLLTMKILLTLWDPGRAAPRIYFLDGGYAEWLNVYPSFVTNPNITPPHTIENDAMDEILGDVQYPDWLKSEQITKTIKKYNLENITAKTNLNYPTKSNIIMNDRIINTHGMNDASIYGNDDSIDLTHLSQEMDNIDLTTKTNSSSNSPMSKPLIDRSNKPKLPSNNQESRALLDLLMQLNRVADYQEKLELQLTQFEKEIYLKLNNDEYDSDDLETLKSQEKAVHLTLQNITDTKLELKGKLETMKINEIPMNNADLKEIEKFELRLGSIENRIANILMARKIQKKKQDEKLKMVTSPNDNNNLIYKEPLKSDGLTTNTGLKRSLSSPNLAQLDDRKTPQIDRSSKPLNIRKNTYETNNNNLRISCRNPGKRMDPVYRHGHPGITGLKNLGNSCYMNSIIQCLSNTAYLAKYFIENSYLDDLNINSDNETRGQIAEEFAHVIKALWRGQYKSIAPRDLKSTIGQYKLQFDSCEQQDSHEFLTFFLDWMHNDLRKADKKLRRDGSLSAAEKEWEKAMEGQTSIISQLFYGQLRSTICCLTCSSRSVTYETFNSLSISLMESSRCTLDDCLKNFLSGQKISGWACPNCKIPRDATKKFDFVKLAPIMVIHLNRFAGTDVGLEKKDTQVIFPLNDLRPHLAIDSDSSVTLRNNSRYYNYNLYAISNHYGSMGGGHYTSLCKNSALNKWYRYDDQTVTEVAESYVKTQHSTAYLLFYSSLQCEPSTYI